MPRLLQPIHQRGLHFKGGMIGGYGDAHGLFPWLESMGRYLVESPVIGHQIFDAPRHAQRDEASTPAQAGVPLRPNDIGSIKQAEYELN